MLNSAVGNWRTSALGFLAGVLNYAQGVGTKLPSNKQEWASFAISAALAGLGIAAKDGQVGSKAL